jgi:hypothetical protein
MEKEIIKSNNKIIKLKIINKSLLDRLHLQIDINKQIIIENNKLKSKL